jgi:CheY-like chemotaxis protein
MHGGAVMLVLIVDDNRDAADSLAMLVRAWGFKLEIAYNGLTALEKATLLRPDVILSDIGLPGLNGFELTEKVLAVAELKGVVVAAVSAYIDEASRKRGKESGMVEHFGKPPDLDALHRFLTAYAGKPEEFS